MNKQLFNELEEAAYDAVDKLWGTPRTDDSGRKLFIDGAKWEQDRLLAKMNKRLGDGMCSCERCDEIRTLIHLMGYSDG